MIRIDLLTCARSEYGLLRPLIKRFLDDNEIDLRIIVSGSHLSEKYGLTVNEIKNDDFPIYKTINIMNDTDDVSKIMANAIAKFSNYFSNEEPDYFYVDGDRYETLGAVLAAINHNIPIIHHGGGAVTLGAIDDCYRHMITKASYLHFTTTELQRKRVIQLGENPKRVFSVGSLGVENAINIKPLTKNELEKSINFSLDEPYAIVTYHPVTFEENTASYQIEQLFKALSSYKYKYIFTLSNSDKDGVIINRLIKEFCNKNEKAICVDSLGAVRYMSALHYADFVIGNSSSGIIEVPSFKIPTINIGDRQKGRQQAISVINCEPQLIDIKNAIEIASSYEFKQKCKLAVNPYGNGDTSLKILNIIKSIGKVNKKSLKKGFYDLEM